LGAISSGAIYEGALSRVVLADDNQKEQLIHFVDESREALEIIPRPVGFGERIANAHDECSLECHQLALLSCENLFQNPLLVMVPGPRLRLSIRKLRDNRTPGSAP
jgi:hypothetical protein